EGVERRRRRRRPASRAAADRPRPARAAAGARLRAVSAARRDGWTSALLLAFGATRLFLLVLHEPMHGYANNYDFIRIESWFHLWPDPAGAPEDFDPRRQHPSAPISTYRIAP